MELPYLIKLLRPQQWIKNLFVFLALFFGGKMLDAEVWPMALIAFMAMCMASSSIYCLNDVLDAKSDRLDPVKRLRPVASGKVSPVAALTMSVLSGSAGLAISWICLPINAFYAILAYLLINLLYCFILKQLALIDLMVIAFGFELRLFIGGVAAGVELSMWLVIMVFLLSFFLGMAKRRDEIVKVDKKLKASARRSARNYNKAFIDISMSVLAAVMLIAYIIYTIQPDVIVRFGTDKLYITALFVLYGLLRYFQITIVEEDTASPTKLMYTDLPLQLAVAGWIASFIFIIYG